MIVSAVNDVKIYNLSAGKTLPSWLSDRKKRQLQKDAEVRRRLELIQDFDMPDVSTYIAMSPDEQFILAAGTYKPRVRCYDVNNLSMKFERCLDAEVIKMLVLSDDYEKLVFLEDERYIEFHNRCGHYFRVRVPKFGRDIAYHPTTAELYIAASGRDLYRLNLEQGRFMASLVTEATSLMCVDVNQSHNLVTVGTAEGCIESWDWRDQNRVAVTDCARALFQSSHGNMAAISSGAPCVSALKSKDALHLAAGMRLMFLANETQKMQIYYMPSVGKAPRWCAFLDNITEELEETDTPKVYDDYKFVTRSELDSLGLSHLVGTNLLRAYMHGYFIHAKLHAKAQSLNDPFAYERYRKEKTQEKLLKERESHLTIKRQLEKLPKVNRELAQKLLEQKELLTSGNVDKNMKGKKKKKSSSAAALLDDSRFQNLFEDPDFQVDPSSEEFRLLNPAMRRIERGEIRKNEKHLQDMEEQAAEQQKEGSPAPSTSSHNDSDADLLDEPKLKNARAKPSKNGELVEKDRKAEARAAKRRLKKPQVDFRPSDAPGSSQSKSHLFEVPSARDLHLIRDALASGGRGKNVGVLEGGGQMEGAAIGTLGDRLEFEKDPAHQPTISQNAISFIPEPAIDFSREGQRSLADARRQEHFEERKSVARRAGHIERTLGGFRGNFRGRGRGRGTFRGRGRGRR